MMRSVKLLKSVVFYCIIAIAVVNAEPWHDGGYLNEVTMEFKTPCHPLSELKGIQPKILFILPRIGARDAVELLQLMPAEYGAVLCGSRTDVVYKNQYENYMTGTDLESKQQELQEKLSQPWDVIVVGSHDLGFLPDASRRKLLVRVYRGTGLLIVNLSADEPREEMMPPGERKPAPVESWIEADATTWMHGSGKVVLLKWRQSVPANEPFSLVSPPEYDLTWRSQYHTQLAGIGQYIRYAAGFSVEPEKPVRRIRDRWNNVLKGEETPGGIYYHDMLGGNGAFAIKVETVPSPVGEITIDIPRTVEPYAGFSGIFSLEKPFDDAATAMIELLDSPYGHLWFKKSFSLEAGQKEVAFTVEKHYLPTLAGYLRVTVYHPINKRPVAIEEKELYFPNRNFADYEQLIWAVARSESIAQQVVDKLGFRMGLSAGDGSYVTRTAKFNQRLVTYTSGIRYSLHADENGRVVLPPNVKPSPLVPDGDYCFYRPNVQQYWREKAGQMIRELKPALYDLGDELRFSYQAGYSKYDNFYFRHFLQQEYGTIQELNANWKTDYPNFDAIPVTEGRNTKNFAAWGDHRAYMEKMYADGLAFLRKEIQKLDPGSFVGMEGSACGDIELTMGQLDYYGPYSHCVNDEVMRSFCKAAIRSNWHGGYPNNTHGGRIRYPLILLEGLVKGSINTNSYYLAWPGHNHSILAADGRISEFGLSQAETMKQLNEGLAQLLVRNKLMQRGVMIYWSPKSQTALLLDSRCGDPVAKSRMWGLQDETLDMHEWSHSFWDPQTITPVLEWAYHRGEGIEFVSARTLERLRKCRVLFLCSTAALSDKEATAIHQFVFNGGTVIADFAPGVLNEHLAPRTSSVLPELFGESSFETLHPPEKWNLDTKIFKAKDVHMRNAPFQVRTLGRGKAVLLNFALADAQLNASDETPFDAMLDGLVPVKPLFQPSEPIKDIMIRVRENPEFTLYTILAVNDFKRVPKMFQKVYKVGEPERRLTITLPDLGYAYQGENGKACFLSDKLYVSFENGPLQQFAFFNSVQTPPKFDVADALLGQPLAFTPPQLSPGRVYRLQIADPSGTIVKTAVFDRQENLPLLAFDFNAPHGTYTATLLDVATGLNSTKQFMLQKAWE